MKTVPISLLFLRLWHHLSPRRRAQIGILLVFMIVASFAEVVSIGALLPFLSVLISPEKVFVHELARPLVQAFNFTEPRQLLLPLTFMFCISTMLAGTMRFALLLLQTKLCHVIGSDFSINIYRRTLFQPYAVHVARNSSEIIAGISSKSGAIVGAALVPLLSILSSSILLLSIMVALIALEPAVAILAFTGFGVIYALVILATKRRLTLDGQRIAYEQNQVIKALQEGLGGIRDVLIDGTQNIFCDIYRNADLPMRRAIANLQIIGNSPRFGVEALGMVLIASLAYSLAMRPGGVDSAIPVLGAMALGAQRLLPTLQQIYLNWTSIRGGQASLSDAMELIDQPLPSFADQPLPKLIPFQNNILVNNLTFRYSPQAPEVLQGLHFSIPKGGRVGFIGSTGSGKSTLLDIVMGLLHPSEGSLEVDGVPITPENYRAWQIHLAHVPQAIFLADTTLAENIAFGVPSDEIDYDRVRQSAGAAQLSKTIESWPQQYQTVVGERGVRLSGGQRQRIGIARALYKQANVIIFDEATSALDYDTEHDVMRAIESLGRELTILIVAHRLITLKNCTQVIELANGRIKRSGTYQQIVENNV